MPAVTVPINALALGPGYLYWAPLGTAEPANTVAGGVFTDAWPGAWLLFGGTDNGSEFSYKLKTENAEVEEFYDPVAIVPVGRDISIIFALAQINTANLKRAMNGGTLTASGSGATQLNTYVPPTVGSEVRGMIGWEAQDSTERLVMYQCLQEGEIKMARRKGGNKATIPVQFNAETPVATGIPFKYWTAGTIRS